MKFNIPKDGKTLSQGKRLVKVKGGVFETEDKALIELLKKAKGVSIVETLKPAAKAKQKQEPQK